MGTRKENNRSMSDQKATIKDLYTVTNELRKDMTEGFARIEAQLAAQALKYATQEQTQQLELRITNLERWRWYLVGAFAVFSGLVIYFSNELKILLLGKH